MIDFDNEKELKDQLKKLYKIDATELVLLKCHLLIEFAMNYFIEHESNKRGNMTKDGFTFSQKVKICNLLGLFVNDPRLKDFILTMNKVRNQIAHGLTYEMKLMEKLGGYPELYNEEFGKKETFIKNQLKGQTLFEAGRIIGTSKAKFQIKSKNPDL